MSSKDYVPSNDADFIFWGKNLTEHADDNYERWVAPKPETIIGNSLDDFIEKYNKAQKANRGKVDIREKKDARKVVEKLFRTYVQGFLAKNPHVTNADRDIMGLTIYDSTPTPVAEPTGQASADIIYNGRMQMQLHMKHVSGTPVDARANYGYCIYYGIYSKDEQQPTTGKDLKRSRFTKQKREYFTFEPEDSGKIVYFTIRYENSKGKAGPWGPMISTFIP